MQKKYWIAPGIISVILIASLLALSNPRVAVSSEKPTCCKKMKKKCPYQQETPTPAQTSLDNLSNQFILLPLY